VGKKSSMLLAAILFAPFCVALIVTLGVYLFG
jgi:hypothetical protein